MPKLTPFQRKLKAAIRKGNELWAEEKYVEALNHLQSVRGFFDESEPIYLRHYLGNVGIVQRALGRADLAVTLYMEALGIPVTTEDEHSDVAVLNANIGNVLIDLQRPDEAHAYLTKAEEYFRNNSKHKLLADVLENRARAYLAQREIKKARTAAHDAYKTARRHSKARTVRHTIRTLATCWEGKQRTKE